MLNPSPSLPGWAPPPLWAAPLVSPAITPSYILTAASDNKSTTQKVTVTVTALAPPPPPTPSLPTIDIEHKLVPWAFPSLTADDEQKAKDILAAPGYDGQGNGQPDGSNVIVLFKKGILYDDLLYLVWVKDRGYSTQNNPGLSGN